MGLIMNGLSANEKPTTYSDKIRFADYPEITFNSVRQTCLPDSNLSLMKRLAFVPALG